MDYPLNQKEPWLALYMSSLVPGLGQVYAGRTFKGIFIFLIQFLLVAGGVLLMGLDQGRLLFTGLSLIGVATAMWVWNTFDVYYDVRKNNSPDFESTRKANKDPWLGVMFSNMLPGLGFFYLRKWIFGIVTLVIFFALVYFEPDESPWWYTVFEAFYFAMACYFTYLKSPSLRETSKTMIIIISPLIIISFLGQNYIPKLIKNNIVEAFRVPTRSMEPAIKAGDRFFVSKSKFTPIRGNIIVFKSPKDLKTNFVKRVAAVGGESVEIKNGRLYINGEEVKTPPFNDISFVSIGNYGKEGEPFKVPNNTLFVLGDNSANSFDSRIFGPISESEVLGKVVKRFWPWKRRGDII